MQFDTLPPPLFTLDNIIEKFSNSACLYYFYSPLIVVNRQGRCVEVSVASIHSMLTISIRADLGKEFLTIKRISNKCKIH